MQSSEPRRPLLVIVSGAPGSGKTTLAERLGAELDILLVAKDVIKEALADALGMPADVASSQRIGRAAYSALFAMAHATLAAGESIVLESNFRRGVSEPNLEPLLAIGDARLVHCTAPADVLEARWRSRVQLGVRHAAHRDGERLAGLRHEIGEGSYEPLVVPCPTLVVDTTTGYSPGLPAIVQFACAPRSVSEMASR